MEELIFVAGSKLPNVRVCLFGFAWLRTIHAPCEDEVARTASEFRLQTVCPVS